jgi:hypothetical protein
VRRAELPRFLRSRIYQGAFGSAQFQAIYPAISASYFQLFTTVEWIGASACLLVAGCFAWNQFDVLGMLFAFLGLGCILGTASAATLAGIHAAREERWHGLRALLGALVTAFLHVAQPCARAWGRFKGWRELRREPPLYTPVQRLWGTIGHRDEWLRRYEHHLRRFGWQARSSCSFAQADLDIVGPGPLHFKIDSVCEERLKQGQHYLRYRVTKSRTWRSYLYFGLCVGGLISAVVCQIWPLLIPLLLFFLILLYAETRLARAIAQIGVEVGESLGMPQIPES